MSTGTNSSKRAPQRSGSSSSRKKMSAKKRKAKQRRRDVYKRQAHKLQFRSDALEFYFGRNRMAMDVLGVTGACLLVKKSIYDQAQGLSENLRVAFNDVEFCYHVYEMGYYNAVSYTHLDKQQLLKLAEPLMKTNYGKYLVEVANGL